MPFTTINQFVLFLSSLGDFTQQFGNARNASSVRSLTNYFAFCQNQCLPPASCSSTTGRCECPSSSYELVDYALDNTQQTCRCPGHPIVYFNGTTCVNATGTKAKHSCICVLSHQRFIYRSNLVSARLHPYANITCGTYRFNECISARS